MYFPPRTPLLFHRNTHKTGNNAIEMSQAFHDIARFKHFTDLNLFKSYLPTLPVFLGDNLQVFHQISQSPGLSTKSPGKYLPWPFSKFFFIDFILFEMSKRKIKQEVDFKCSYLSSSRSENVKNRAIKLIYI